MDRQLGATVVHRMDSPVSQAELRDELQFFFPSRVK